MDDTLPKEEETEDDNAEGSDQPANNNTISNGISHPDKKQVSSGSGSWGKTSNVVRIA